VRDKRHRLMWAGPEVQSYRFQKVPYHVNPRPCYRARTGKVAYIPGRTPPASPSVCSERRREIFRVTFRDRSAIMPTIGCRLSYSELCQLGRHSSKRCATA
jgi:hypothetical protein